MKKSSSLYNAAESWWRVQTSAYLHVNGLPSSKPNEQDVGFGGGPPLSGSSADLQ